MKQGATVQIPGAVEVFSPNYDMDKLNDEQKESMSKLDFSKGIVTGMTLKAVYSNVGEPVSVGLNLFQNKPQIVNNEGWLFTETNTDMGSAHASEQDGYINLVNVLPYEKAHVKVSKNVVNNVIKQLYEQVIMQIPYTSFETLSARFHANNVPEGDYKVMCEFLVQYKYPAISNGETAAEE